MRLALRYPGAYLLFFVCIWHAEARPPHRQALADHYGPFLARKLNDCTTCHLPDPPGKAADSLTAEKPHNPFGQRLAAVRGELRQAGKKTTMAQRLEAVAEEDSDGDGVTNLLEILSGHAPGDPTDKPTPAEISAARQKLNDYVRFRTAYPWRPFEVVTRPAVPVPPTEEGGKGAWIRNPIDAFLAAEHVAHGLTPRPEAPRPVLLRRVYLDLTGLPPTREELHAFLADPSPDAYEKVVERLLNSPRYGERWGRHWMDIWRYSDWAGWTDGGQIRDSQPHIWRWRDWIVEALNRDKPYDQMILEMLAGDELAPDDPDTLRATGYLVRNYKMLSREKWLQDTVDHTFQAFLGVTLGCARCHDHMYDPILQKEYYQVRAIFEPHHVRIDRVPGQLDTRLDGLARVYDAKPEEPTYLLIRGDDRTPDKSQALPPGVPEALGGRFPDCQPVPLPPCAVAPDKRPAVIADLRKAAEDAIAKAQAEQDRQRRHLLTAATGLVLPGPGQLVAVTQVGQRQGDLGLAELDLQLARTRREVQELQFRLEELEDGGRKDTPEWQNTARLATVTQRLAAALEARRNLQALTQQVLHNPAARQAHAQAFQAATTRVEQTAAALLQLPDTHYERRPVAIYPAASTGRRLAFARWLASRDNPLTARVAVNHIWLRHFGQALVPSVFDFGRNGRPPSHPALLDWLAAEFMDCGWSMKALHRLIVTSSAYRMASTPDPVNLERDRDNRCLWRMPSRRLEAEAVRDSVLYVAGQLDLTMGGPDIDHNLGLTVPRRSLYFRHAQEKQMEFLKIFDVAAVTECYQRKESVLPQQALALANSALVRQQARVLAQRLAGQFAAPAAFVTAAFEQVLSRPPTAAELGECLGFLQEQTGRAAGTSGSKSASEPALRAREALVHVLLNHNDFVTIR